MNELGQPIAEGRTAEIFAWGEGRVLKLFRAGGSHQSRDYEYNIARAVYRSGVPAPNVFEAIEIEGRPGIIYERVEGPTLLRELLTHPERLIELAQGMADLHAEVHRHTVDELPRASDRFAQMLDRTPLSDAQKAEIAQRAAALPTDNRVCHGDFHPDNIVLTPAGLRVIDWNNASAGHPLADVAYTALILRMGEAPPDSDAAIIALFQARMAFHDAYVARRLGSDRDQMNAWLLPAMVVRLADNIPNERERLIRLIDQTLSA